MEKPVDFSRLRQAIVADEVKILEVTNSYPGRGSYTIEIDGGVVLVREDAVTITYHLDAEEAAALRQKALEHSLDELDRRRRSLSNDLQLATAARIKAEKDLAWEKQSKCTMECEDFFQGTCPFPGKEAKKKCPRYKMEEAV